MSQNQLIYESPVFYYEGYEIVTYRIYKIKAATTFQNPDKHHMFCLHSSSHQHITGTQTLIRFFVKDGAEKVWEINEGGGGATFLHESEFFPQLMIFHKDWKIIFSIGDGSAYLLLRGFYYDLRTRSVSMGITQKRGFWARLT